MPYQTRIVDVAMAGETKVEVKIDPTCTIMQLALEVQYLLCPGYDDVDFNLYMASRCLR